MNGAVVDRGAVCEQVERILRSQSLANKNQLKKLLEVLFRNIDSQSALKPDRVIEELWPTEIKTKGSADVATEMNRLRRALEFYYETEGRNDPITISLPSRSATVHGGVREERWIVASPRRRIGDQAPAAVVKPLRTAKVLAATAAVAAALSVGAYLSIRVFGAHPHPRSGRLDGSTLRIMDADGKELWSKNFPEGFGPDWYYGGKGVSLASPSRIWFADIEGTGHLNVLFAYSSAGEQPHASTLICYSDRGEEQWRWTPGRELPELNGSPSTYKILALGVLKATKKRAPQIAVLSEHDPWWPSQLALLDSHGKTISEYWHSGGLRYLVLADLDGDGREEIIASGASEYDHRATLVVLDPDRVYGASRELQPEFQIHGMGEARERLRLIFPRSDLNLAMSQFNLATDPTVENGVLRLTVAECIIPPGCPIWYEFDRNFHLISAFAGGDEFRGVHNRFFQTGKNAHMLTAEEQAAFQKVRCLVGCKTEFVPVGNLVP